MTTKALKKQIEAAKIVIGEAEKDLQTVVDDAAAASPPEREKASQAVEAASLKVKAAEAQLVALERLLVVASAEAAMAAIETARTEVTHAEKELERVLGGIKAPPGQETWVTQVVESAFSRLRTAKRALLDLEASIEIAPGHQGS